MSRTQIIRTEPRISLNALTEYLHVNASRRRKIIEEQKRPNDFQVIYYQYAQDAIAKFIADGMSDEEILQQEIDRLFHKTPANDYDKYRLSSNVKAIQSFLSFYSKLNTHGLSAQLAPDSQPKMMYGGIRISVRPEVILIGNMPRYENPIGAVKLLFNKQKKNFLTAKSAVYPAALVYDFLRKIHHTKAAVHKVTYVIDVFAKEIYSAPKATARLMADVDISCQEIAMWWPTI